jgi:phage tail-like protein
MVAPGSSDQNTPPVLDRPADPLMAFRFAVTVESAHGTRVLGGFSDVTGLAVESEVEVFRAGGQNSADVALPGPIKFATRLVLKRGLSDPEGLWRWYRKVMTGVIERENVRISLRSELGADVMSWNFKEACPVKWMGPELHAGNAAIAFESVELVHRGLLPS